MHTCIRQLDGLSEGGGFGTKRGSNALDGSQIFFTELQGAENITVSS
jgi:hypothetical protein